MRWLFLTLAVLVCAAVLIFGLVDQASVGDVYGGHHLRALLAYHPALLEDSGYVLDAYRSVLEEEGIPHDVVDLYTLSDVPPADLVATAPALVLPDGLCRRLHSAFDAWLETYLEAGGAVAVIHDAGLASQTGGQLPRSFLARHTGVQHVVPDADGERAHAVGRVVFADAEAAAFCGIPPGKLDEDLYLTGYGYGRLDYPIALSRLETAPGHEPARVLAWAETGDGTRHPAVTLSGRALYVNLPLGHLKAYADDLPLRALMRRFLVDVAGLPALVPAPEGVGAVVINWHVDFVDDRYAVDAMDAAGLLRADLPASFHICAGPDVNAYGDGQGFAAYGDGRAHLLRLAAVGEIGSHGGWIHNYSADRIERGLWDADSIRTYLTRNADCLSEVTGRPVRVYSAPDGVHPQPLMTRLLEEQGFEAYYYTGDSGSAPNRSFHAGARLSESLIAFPVMPRADLASFAEMDAALALPPDSVLAWLESTADYCARERVVRLVYSHPYNLIKYDHDLDYMPVVVRWYDRLAQRQADGELAVRTMGDCAAHLHRICATDLSVTVDGSNATLILSNADGLAGVALRLPHARWAVETPPGCRRLDDETETILVVTDDLARIEIPATRR